MAEDLKPSRRTFSRRGNALAGQDILDILENALFRVSERWGAVQVSVSGSDDPVSLILPAEIRFCQQCQHLRMVSDMGSDFCKRCQ